MSEDNRRKYPRVDLNLLVQFRAKDYDTFLSDYAANISMGGMLVQTHDPRPEGSTLFFQFTTEQTGPLIEGMARVTHVQPMTEGQPAAMGLEFISVDEDSQALIRELVSARLAHTSH